MTEVIELAPPVEVEKPAEPKEPVLARALDILRVDHWIRGCWRNTEGRCLVSAIHEAHSEVNGNGNFMYLDWKFEIRGSVNALGFPNADEAIQWNDAESRTWEEVEERLERAAYGA